MAKAKAPLNPATIQAKATKSNCVEFETNRSCVRSQDVGVMYLSKPVESYNPSRFKKGTLDFRHRIDTKSVTKELEL